MESIKIAEIFDRLINAFEQQNYEDILDLFHEDLYFEHSAIGKAVNRHEFIRLMNTNKIDADSIKIRIFNNVLRSEEEKACQSAYMVLLIYKDIRDFRHIFQCGFLTELCYAKEEDWKIISFRSNMTFECGNSMIVGSHWKLIDYKMFNGNDFHLFAKRSGPWMYKQSDILSEEQKVMQTFYHYCWLIDTCSFDQLDQVYCDPFIMKNEKLPAFNDGKAVSLTDAEQMFKKKRYLKILADGQLIPKEACWNHIAHFEQLQINGNYAKAVIYRYEPNRIGTRFLHKYNYKTIYYSGIWELELVKENKEIWKIEKYSFKNQIVEDANEKDKSNF